MKKIPYWLDTPYTPRNSLNEHIETDILVIGGGITGVSTAYHCVKNGFKTVLVEKNSIASGSAGKNGGMIVEGLAIDFLEAVEQFGIDQAQIIWSETTQAQELIKHLIKEHKIKCSFSEEGSLYIGIRPEDIKWLKEEHFLRTTNGISAEFIETSPFGPYIFNKKDAGLDPVKFVRGLAQIAESIGLRIFENTEIISSGKEIITNKNYRIKANKIVFAIESYDSKNAQTSIIVDSLGIMTEKLTHGTLKKMNWPQGEMLWTTGADYICVRKVGDRLFINGDDKEKTLKEFFGLFPQLRSEDIQISHEWNGKIMYPVNHRPKILLKNGMHHVLGMGGNGLTNGVIVGKRLADSFNGLEIPQIYHMLE